jgi:hypothetical protein
LERGAVPGSFFLPLGPSAISVNISVYIILYMY